MPTESLRRIAYDSSVCIDFGRGRISIEDWGLVRKHILKHYEYCMSPITLYELVRGLGRAPNQYFLSDRRAVEALYPSHSKVFLQLPRYFVLEHVFGRHVDPPENIATDLDRWCRAILKARSRTELESGKLMLSGYSGGFGLHLDEIVRQIEDKQRGYVEAFQNLRSIESGRYTPELWAESVLGMIGQQVTSQNLNKVICALDAPYFFGKELWGFFKIDVRLRSTHL